jgi:S-adenosylmethionine/arginine decarboxylase-like enzyme
MKNIKTTQVYTYGCEPKLIDNIDFMNSFLEDLVDIIDMNKIPPELIKGENPKSFYFDAAVLNLPDEDAGITGVITLFESHCAFHSWTKYKFCCIVICSCKDYNSDLVAYFCKDRFKAENVSYKTIVM